MKIQFLMAALMVALAITPHALAAQKAPYKYAPDAKVELGADGKLKYTPDKRGNQIPDFSMCGYMGGGVKLPDVPVVKTISPSGTKEDDTARIQKAIDEVCALPLKKSGFRGALLLKRGTYPIKGTLTIHASGVVLRGEGQHEDGTIISGIRKLPYPNGGRTLLEVRPKMNRKIEEIAGSRREIADSYVPWGVKSFTLKSTEGLSVGDNVVVYRPCTLEWLDAIGMKKYWSQPKEMNGLNFHFERQIVAIDGNRIILNAPTVNAMEDKYGGGFVYRFTEEGGLTQVGVESLRFVAVFGVGLEGTGDPGRRAVVLYDCVNSWARNVTGVHFSYATLVLGGARHGGCKFVTVQDCAYLKPMGQGGGGSRYPFPNQVGQYCLFQRCFADKGSRHSYQVGARSRGPNVYLDCVNHGDDAGPHHRWAMGALYDNICGGQHIVPDRRRWTEHGWSGAQIVHWNGVGWSAGGTQQPTARNYWFGMQVKKGLRQEGPVEPRSLYLKQLEERLGKQAVENITTEGQRKAVTDSNSEQSRDTLIWGPIKHGIGEQINHAK